MKPKLNKKQVAWINHWETVMGFAFLLGDDQDATFADRVSWNTQYVHDLSASAQHMEQDAPIGRVR